ncbi:Histone H1 [Sphaceloma murrayae]|uniref:Histone H1 n=1 Tax=Sphaceloma murrayae TaxID=2082308 RepID=A0A2K1QLV9_9PEZI|nr:Histone H1 [Sphaceloma murrayae]
MAPKAASKASAPKKTASAAAHPTYQDMIKEAVIQLKERNGSSRQTLKKYVMANNSLGNISDGVYTARFNQALAKGSETGVFVRPKGASGPVKLGKATGAKPAKASSPPAAKETKPKTATKAKTTKAAPKKAAAAPTKKTATKAAPKKAAAKANTGKSRKTAPAAPAAPAVGEEKSTVLSKTKSGRVSKTTKAPAPKKAAPAKKAAPKKATTKKSTPKKA